MPNLPRLFIPGDRDLMQVDVRRHFCSYTPEEIEQPTDEVLATTRKLLETIVASWIKKLENRPTWWLCGAQAGSTSGALQISSSQTW